MKDLIRVVLIDPNEESRTALERMLGGIATFWLSEVFTTYQDAASRATEIVAHLTMVTLDEDPSQALELIQKLTQANPDSIVLPASRGADSGLILRAIRAGAREFLPLPAEATELIEAATRLLRGRGESQTASARARESSRSRAHQAESAARRWRSTWRRPWPPARARRPSWSISTSCSARSTPGLT